MAQVVLAALRQDGYALLDASEALRSTREIVCEAVRQTGNALRYGAPPPPFFYFILFFFNFLFGMTPPADAPHRPHCLAPRYASEELRNDREVVSLAVSRNGVALAYAAVGLRRDPGIALLALSRNEHALR